MPQKKSTSTYKRSNVSVKVSSKDKKDSGLFSFEMHPTVLVSLIIVTILFLTAAIIAYFAFDTTVDVIFSRTNSDVDDSTPDMLEKNDTPIIEQQDSDKVNCDPLTFSVMCDSEFSGNECQLLKDNDLETQWLSLASCINGKTPCSVLNEVTLTSSKKFKLVKLYNRYEQQFYINRVLLDYNDIKDQQKIIGYEYSQKPWVVELDEPTDALRIQIVEIVGFGRNYQTGLAEIYLYPEGCNDYID